MTQQNEEWDVKQWKALLQTPSKENYEKMLAKFPTNAPVWIEYINWAAANDQAVEPLFEQSLVKLNDLHLWKLYLQHVREKQSEENLYSTQVKSIMCAAYEFTLNHVGIDYYSNGLWSDYVSYLTEYLTRNSGSGADGDDDDSDLLTLDERKQVVDQLRQTYIRCCSLPLSCLDNIWKEYETFESKVAPNAIHGIDASSAGDGSGALVSATASNSAYNHSVQQGRKFIAERTPYYIHAKSKCRQLQSLVDAIPKNAYCTPPSFSADSFVSGDGDQSTQPDNNNDQKMQQKVKEWFLFEVANPLNFSDGESVMIRAAFVFRYALNNYFYRFPAVWIDFIMYLVNQQDVQLDRYRLADIAKEAIDSCPFSVLIHSYLAQMYVLSPQRFGVMQSADGKNAVADAESIRNKAVEEGKNLFESILKRYESRIEQVRINANGGDVSLKKYERDLIELANSVWVHYIQFVRQVDSNSQKATRQIFSRARKTSYADYSPPAELALPSSAAALLFKTSAMLEYWCYQDKNVCFKILEVGLKSFKTDVSYISCYMDHLLLNNDVPNAKALFERSLNNVQLEGAMILWKKLLAYESAFGDLNSLAALEKRFFSIYNYVNDHDWLGSKLCQDLNLLHNKELGSAPRYNFYGVEPSIIRVGGQMVQSQYQQLQSQADSSILNAQNFQSLQQQLQQTRAVSVGNLNGQQQMVMASASQYTTEPVTLPATKDEESLFPPLKNAIGITIPDEYVKKLEQVGRPDVSLFNSFNATERPNVFTPAGPQMPLMMAPAPMMMGGPPVMIPPPATAHAGGVKRPGSPSGSQMGIGGAAAPYANNMMMPSPGQQIPYEVQMFISRFPVGQAYQGRQVNPDMVLDVLKNANLQPPPGYTTPPHFPAGQMMPMMYGGVSPAMSSQLPPNAPMMPYNGQHTQQHQQYLGMMGMTGGGAQDYAGSIASRDSRSTSRNRGDSSKRVRRE
ncbi:hypothetical protein MP228_009622 [Amoeboaphelidium protococcarum]|nr:hypothetical protein MP228_009622 [Amoeboaphelidium protococcarum]